MSQKHDADPTCLQGFRQNLVLYTCVDLAFGLQYNVARKENTPVIYECSTAVLM